MIAKIKIETYRPIDRQQPVRGQTFQVQSLNFPRNDKSTRHITFILALTDCEVLQTSWLSI
jgi:hypothetical protein